MSRWRSTHRPARRLAVRTTLIYAVALLVLVVLTSCASQTELPAAVRFDAAQWARERTLPMAVDLVRGERLLALNKAGVLELLGVYDDHLIASNEAGLVPNLVLSYRIPDRGYTLSMTLTDGLVTEASIERRRSWSLPATVLTGHAQPAPGNPALSSGARARSLDRGGRSAAGAQLWAVIGAALDTEERAAAVLDRATTGEGEYAQSLTIQRAATVGLDGSDMPYVVVALYEDGHRAQEAYAAAFRTPGLGRPCLELVTIGTRDPVPVVDRIAPQDSAFSRERWVSLRPAPMAIALAKSAKLLGWSVVAVEDLLGAPDWASESADSAGTVGRMVRYELDNGEVLHIHYWDGRAEWCAVY